ncbi:MAG: trigger factor, partial [Thermodesulfobacteriota bacterium]|nr:trigger factor [Thermodesulfobacteriota bacterium]
VILDYEGFLGNESIEGEKVSDHLLELGSGTFSKEFEDQLMGLDKGEKKDIQIILPETHEKADLAGKEVIYKVTLKGIKEKIIPELSDDFAKDLGEFETLEELRQNIKETLEMREKLRIESRLREKILEKLVEENPFELPPSMLDQHLEYLINDIQMKLSFQGLTMDQIGLTTESLSEKYRDQAEKEVRGGLLLEEIGKKESIEVTEEDLEERINEIANRSGQDVEKIRDYYNENSAKQRLKNGMATEKILDFIVNEAKIEEVERGEDDTHSHSD